MFKHLKKDFPFYQNHKDLIYLDNAATTQKPNQMLDAMNRFYEHHNAPVHRGVYQLAENATQIYELARATVAQCVSAHADELVFTSGTTEAINFIAASWAVNLKKGDEIIITELEHHSNCAPWIRLEKTHGIVLKYLTVTSHGLLNYDLLQTLITQRTKLIAFTASSNVLGTPVDVKRIVSAAKAVGARVLVDAAQVIGRAPVNVHELDVDFLAFSAHKMFGPTGIGALYIARDVQHEVEPYQTGGGMVYSVDFHDVTWAQPPRKYEAGTPAIAQAVGFAAAVDYLQKKVDFDLVKKHEARLCAQLIEGLQKISGIFILGDIEQIAAQGHIVSFIHENYHAHDLAAYLDSKGICVRAGNHCAQPLHKALAIESSIRVSFCMLNESAEVGKLVNALKNIKL